MNKASYKIAFSISILFLCLTACFQGTEGSSPTQYIDSLKTRSERLAMELQTDSLKETAGKYLKATLPYSRDYFKAYQFQLLAEFNAKNYDKVIAGLNRAKSMPRNTDYTDIICHYQYTRARSLQYSGRTNEAIDAFKKCLIYDSDNEEERETIRTITLNSLLQLMNTHLATGKADECVAYLDSLKNNPSPLIKEYCYRDVCSLLAYSLYYTDNTEQAEKQMEEALNTTLYEPTPERFFRDYSYAAAIYYGNSLKQEQAIEYCKKAIEAAEAYKYNIGIQWTTALLGKIYHKMGKIDDAVDLYTSSATVAQEKKDWKGVANAYNSLADLYIYWERYNQANEYATASLNNNLKQINKDATLCGEAYLMKGIVMSKMGVSDSAIYYWEKADSCFSKMPYTAGTINVDKQMGAFLVESGTSESLQEGIDRLQRVLKSTAWYDRAPSYLQLAKGLIKQNKTNAGEAMLDSMYSVLNSSQSPFYLEDAYRFALQHYLEKNDAANIKRYANAYLTENQRRFDAHVTKKVTDAMIEYQTEKKEQELLLKNAELSRKELTVQLYIAVSVCLLILLLSGYGWYIYKQRLHKIRHQLAEQRCEKLIEDIHSANQHSQKVESLLSELLTSKNSRLEITSVTPELYRKGGENKFRERFMQLHPTFLLRLKERVPGVTPSEEVLCMLIVLGQTTEQMTEILCIARSSVNMTRHRLRKKMNLSKEESLEDIIKELQK